MKASKKIKTHSLRVGNILLLLLFVQAVYAQKFTPGLRNGESCEMTFRMNDMTVMWTQDFDLRIKNSVDPGLATWEIKNVSNVVVLSGSGDLITVTADLDPGFYMVNATLPSGLTIESTLEVLPIWMVTQTSSATVNGALYKNTAANGVSVTLPVQVSLHPSVNAYSLPQRAVSLTGIGGEGLDIVPQSTTMNLVQGLNHCVYHFEGMSAHGGPARMVFFDACGAGEGLTVFVNN